MSQMWAAFGGGNMPANQTASNSCAIRTESVGSTTLLLASARCRCFVLLLLAGAFPSPNAGRVRDLGRLLARQETLLT